VRPLAFLVLAVLLASCASSGSRSGGRDRDIITAEEIADVQVATAYDIVQTLRPEYLRTRGLRSMGASQPQGAVVYVDNVRRGGPESLRTLPRESVLEIRYLNGADATTMYGTNHGDGAILVRTRR
jgi:hypothetical protein